MLVLGSSSLSPGYRLMLVLLEQQQHLACLTLASIEETPVSLTDARIFFFFFPCSLRNVFMGLKQRSEHLEIRLQQKRVMEGFG